MAHLFEPLPLRGVVLPNRIGVPPMCQYSAVEGVAQDWHLVHYGGRAVGGAGLLIVEATAVVPEGRISPGDLGLWEDRQVEPLARVVRFVRAQGTVAAVQLAHAGRKGSATLGWQPPRGLQEGEGGWATVAPSALAYSEAYAPPRALDEDGLRRVVSAFASAAQRAALAGFQVVELHAAHGYLLHEFLSPLSNQRTDAYGGSFENRTRLLKEVVQAVRAVWPDERPLLVRLSATDWVEGGWTVEETVALCRQLRDLGVDLFDVSSAGTSPKAKFPVGPGFQTELSARVKREAQVPTAAVGLITSPEQADTIIRTGQADVALVGRQVLRSPAWPLEAARALGHGVPWPPQYLRAGPPGAPSRRPPE